MKTKLLTYSVVGLVMILGKTHRTFAWCNPPYVYFNFWPECYDTITKKSYVPYGEEVTIVTYEGELYKSYDGDCSGCTECDKGSLCPGDDLIRGLRIFKWYFGDGFIEDENCIASYDGVFDGETTHTYTSTGPMTLKVGVWDVDKTCDNHCPPGWRDQYTELSKSIVVVKADLDISGVADGDEEDPGGYVKVNDDDDDDDGIADCTESGTVSGEDDLVPISLWVSTVSGGMVRLGRGNSKIKVWNSSTKGTLIIPDDANDYKEWSPGSMPSTLYVEGVSSSSSLKDTSLTLSYERNSCTVHSDTVKFTVVTVDLDMSGVTDAEETKKGGYIALNDDDDNDNGTADKDDSGTVTGENDLLSITLQAVSPTALTGTVTLKALAGGSKIKVWTSSWKVTEVTLPKTYSTPTDLPKTLYVEGNDVSVSLRDVTLALEYSVGGNTFDDRIKATVVQVDLDMSGVADNEETHTGGFVVLNDNDSDSDGTPDKSETGPITGEIDLAALSLQKVRPTGLTGTVTLKALAGGSKIKVWTTDTKGTEVTLPKTYSTPADLPKNLYVEGYAASASVRDITLALEYTVEGKTFGDRVKVTVIDGDLIIHNGLEGVSGGQAISEADEETKGAVTVTNFNDTDGDGVLDYLDDDVSVSGANPPGREEHDLMKLIFEEPKPNGIPGSVRVHWISGVRVIWLDGPTGKLQSKSNGQPSSLTQPMSAFSSDHTGDGNKDIRWWVEGTYTSDSLRDLKLAYEYQPPGSSTWYEMDRVAATVFWVSKPDHSPWRIRQGASGFPDNPEPGPGKDLPDCDKESVVNYVNNDWPTGYRAVDDSRYGHGPFRNNAGLDTEIGGRILYEFEVEPDVNGLGVVFDITRQVKWRTREIDHGLGTPSPPMPDRDTFPEGESPQRDNETPTDDAGTVDEDNDPNNNLIYVYDGPSVLRSLSKAFVTMRWSFREWVRVKFSGSFSNNNGLVEGSRASGKKDWHLLNYAKFGWDSGGKLVEDSTSPSYSLPLFTGSGNGTIAVTLLADAVTEGFTATYDEPNKKWTLTGTAGGSANDTKNPAPAGTQWTLTIGTKVQVVITQGVPAFGNGDQFKFSVFKSTAPNGKQNEISTGSIDVTEGP